MDTTIDCTKLLDSLKIEKLTEIDYRIRTNAYFLNGESFVIHLVKIENDWYLSDRKSTLRYMNEKYELSSKDVKMCISSVLKLYGFKISAGVLLAKIKDENDLKKRFYDFLMCMAQLANMFAFFDDPKG